MHFLIFLLSKNFESIARFGGAWKGLGAKTPSSKSKLIPNAQMMLACEPKDVSL